MRVGGGGDIEGLIINIILKGFKIMGRGATETGGPLNQGSAWQQPSERCFNVKKRHLSL